MRNIQNCDTIRGKWLAGYNFLWNSNSGEVHYTGASCGSSHHMDRITAPHEHFLRGHYERDGQRSQLFVDMWDPLTAPASRQVRYSNCAFCHPEQRARA